MGKTTDLAVRWAKRALPSSLRRRLRGWHRQAPLVTPAATPRQFDRFVFIAGLHRSGTTLVEQLLHAATEVTVLRAPVPENEGQHLQDVYPIAARHGGPGRFAFAPAMQPAPLAPYAAAAARDRLLRCWTPWLVGNTPVLVEKSPPNLTRLAWLRSVFPGAQFVIVVRDPRVVAAATRKWSGQTIADLLRHWAVAYQIALSEWAADCHIVRYEELCADPVAVIDSLRVTLGLAARPGGVADDARFREVADTNARYLDERDAAPLGPGPWERFDYS